LGGFEEGERESECVVCVYSFVSGFVCEKERAWAGVGGNHTENEGPCRGRVESVARSQVHSSTVFFFLERSTAPLQRTIMPPDPEAAASSAPSAPPLNREALASRPLSGAGPGNEGERVRRKLAAPTLSPCSLSRAAVERAALA